MKDMKDCIAFELGCGCQDMCKAEYVLPPRPRRASLFSEFVTALLVGIVIACAAYVGLSRAETAYQQEQRV